MAFDFSQSPSQTIAKTGKDQGKRLSASIKNLFSLRSGGKQESILSAPKRKVVLKIRRTMRETKNTASSRTALNEIRNGSGLMESQSPPLTAQIIRQ